MVSRHAWAAAALGIALAGCSEAAGPSDCDALSTALSSASQCRELCEPLLADAGATPSPICVAGTTSVPGTTCDQDLSANHSGYPSTCSGSDQAVLAAKTACLTTFAEHFQQAGHASTVSGGNVGFSCDVTVNEYQSDTTLLLSCLTEAGVLSSDCAAAFAPASAQCADGGS